MKRLTSAQLFDAPKRARKTKARLARAKLQIVVARERAAVTAQRYTAHALARPMRLPTVLQRGPQPFRFDLFALPPIAGIYSSSGLASRTAGVSSSCLLHAHILCARTLACC